MHSPLSNIAKDLQSGVKHLLSQWFRRRDSPQPFAPEKERSKSNYTLKRDSASNGVVGPVDTTFAADSTAESRLKRNTSNEQPAGPRAQRSTACYAQQKRTTCLKISPPEKKSVVAPYTPSNRTLALPS